MALKMKNVIQAKAKEKQQGGQGGILLSQKSDEANGMRTDEELSKLAGVSRRPSESNILWNLRILRTFQTCVLVAFVFAV